LHVAVPDGNFRNASYQNIIQVGGPGLKDHPAATHKIGYTYETLSEGFTQAGFAVELLQCCDAEGNFPFRYWNAIIGAKKERVIRSLT